MQSQSQSQTSCFVNMDKLILKYSKVYIVRENIHNVQHSIEGEQSQRIDTTQLKTYY